MTQPTNKPDWGTHRRLAVIGLLGEWCKESDKPVKCEGHIQSYVLLGVPLVHLGEQLLKLSRKIAGLLVLIRQGPDVAHVGAFFFPHIALEVPAIGLTIQVYAANPFPPRATNDINAMNEAEYRRARSTFLRDGVLRAELYEELAGVAQRMVRRRLLPPVYAPYGQWDHEATEEVAQGWITHRLVGAGLLRALLARAPELYIFRAHAERSLRQFLLNERERSQAQNLFARIRSLLDEDPRFRCFIVSQRPQDRWYGLDAWDRPIAFDGDPRKLKAAAWSVGELVVIRYRADARKLSPVLDAAELNRFVLTVLTAVGSLLTPRHLLDALATRVALEDTQILAYEDAGPEAAEDPRFDERIGLRELAAAALAELTRRQADVLLGTADGRTLEDMAADLDCSRATVLNEQRRAGQALTRLSGDDENREVLLNAVVDLLYESEEK